MIHRAYTIQYPTCNYMYDTEKYTIYDGCGWAKICIYIHIYATYVKEFNTHTQKKCHSCGVLFCPFGKSPEPLPPRKARFDVCCMHSKTPLHTDHMKGRTTWIYGEEVISCVSNGRIGIFWLPKHLTSPWVFLMASKKCNHFRASKLTYSLGMSQKIEALANSPWSTNSSEGSLRIPSYWIFFETHLLTGSRYAKQKIASGHLTPREVGAYALAPREGNTDLKTPRCLWMFVALRHVPRWN